MYILNFLLAVPLFIKNNDLPCCVNCIHFIESKNNYPYDTIPDNNSGKCKLFGVKNVKNIILYINTLKLSFASFPCV